MWQLISMLISLAAGNWLRDYSQAMDVAGLSKLSRQAIINVVMVLGFLAHGYATGEFEVTEARLGVYLVSQFSISIAQSLNLDAQPTEHIDNPKDYNDNKDARTVHPALRPPVDPQELEVDPRTGMLVTMLLFLQWTSSLIPVPELHCQRKRTLVDIQGCCPRHSSTLHRHRQTGPRRWWSRCFVRSLQVAGPSPTHYGRFPCTFELCRIGAA